MKRLSDSITPNAFLFISIALVFALSGCATSGKDKADSGGTGSEFSDAGATAGSEGTGSAAERPKGWTDPGMVHFEFDQSEITDQGIPVLKNVAGQLDGKSMKIVISGYTDDRGTEEYNLALGERRAAAARRYLVNLGVPEDQMTIVSYGELRPLRRDNNDAAWAMNRRAQFAPIE
ncbi:MAG: peptidoglycan-associated lipoprotein [Deltaproteobacteria bacterium]|nr:peptidoglycan-associated lipoprotein [Deltaproteobacteria bacterium]